MAAIKSYYLSRILDARVYAPDGKKIGRVKELLCCNEERPRVTAGILKTKSGELKTLDWSNFDISKGKASYQIYCAQLTEVTPDENSIYLKKHILDKQIVDIDGKKVVRVNDVRLADISNGMFVMAVDVGTEGLLRRLLPHYLVKPVSNWVSARFILWSNMEPIGSPMDNLKLSTPSSKLNTLHPSELADIIEDLDIKTGTALFNSLDHDRAADVLEELESETQSSILDQLSVEKAADVLEKMPADEVADILDDLQEAKAEELLQEMDKETSDEVRELMEYPEHSVGSLMTTDYISFKDQMTVAETIIELRRLKPEPDTIYYLYVVDDKERLTAIISLRDLVVSEPETRLYEIMNRKIIYVYDDDHVNSLVDIISKYSLLAIPVVDRDMTMLGVVIIDDVVYELLKPRRKRV